MLKNPEAVSARLIAAYSSGPIAPLRDVLSPADGVGAYAVQAASVDRWLSDGRRMVGRKVGLTAATVQAQLGVDQPDFGVLFEDMEIPDGGTLRASCVLQPKAEAEVAFRMARDIKDPAISREQLSDAIDAVVPAIEIVDSRIVDWKISFADTVADNGSSAYFAMGAAQRFGNELDLWSCGMVLEVDGQVRSIGAGAACLGHPLNATLWLARTLVERGDFLRAGDVVLSGALGPMVALNPGATVRATIGGLGSVTFNFVEDR